MYVLMRVCFYVSMCVSWRKTERRWKVKEYQRTTKKEALFWTRTACHRHTCFRTLLIQPNNGQHISLLTWDVGQYVSDVLCHFSCCTLLNKATCSHSQTDGYTSCPITHTHSLLTPWQQQCATERVGDTPLMICTLSFIHTNLLWGLSKPKER